MKVQEFLDLMVPLAVADMKKSGVLASVTLAQAILESGWITSELAVRRSQSDRRIQGKGQCYKELPGRLHSLRG